MRAAPKLVVALSAVVAAVGLGAVVVQKDRILERWYLYQLERGEEKKDEEQIKRAVAGLGEVGGEAALMKLETRNDVTQMYVGFELIHVRLREMFGPPSKRDKPRPPDYYHPYYRSP